MKNKQFGVMRYKDICGVQVACIYGDEDVWFDRYDIGHALGYDNPEEAVKNIHAKHEDTLQSRSTIADVAHCHEIAHDCVLYNIIGVLEICRLSNKLHSDDVGDAFYDLWKDALADLSYNNMTNEDIGACLKARIEQNPEGTIRVLIQAMMGAGWTFEEAVNDLVKASEAHE